jgi:haloalkane dehalogenase
MDFYDTPPDRFRDLVDYPFAPHFMAVDPAGLRMHYVDEGPRDGASLLLLHGEPTWSYLYRFMISPLVAAGHRVIAPDLIGFGKSSKPTRVEDYSYQRHVDWMSRFCEALELRDVTLFAHDWGSFIGLRLVADHPDRFARVGIGNGFLPTGETPGRFAGSLIKGAALLAWRTFAQRSPWFVASRIVASGCARNLTSEERRAYDAPFPTRSSLAGARAFPSLVPITPSDPAHLPNLEAWEILRSWEKPFLTLFSDGDPMMGELDRILQARIPGAKALPHHRVQGGHFLQEDAGAELAERLDAFIRADG